MSVERISVCHVVGSVSQSLFLEAVVKFVDRERYDISFIFLDSRLPEIAGKLESLGAEVSFVSYRGRKDLLSATFKLVRLFRAKRPRIVHTHLVESSIVGLTAALLSRIKLRVHTRHHGAECHRYYRRGVLYDRYINALSKRVMAITGVVREILIEREGVSPKKVKLINYGYDLSSLSSTESGIEAIRKKYSISEQYPVIGVVSRFVHWKGVQHVIPAFANVIKKYPNALLVLANATGSYENEIRRLIDENLLQNNVLLIPFEPKIFDLYSTFDIFVHVPIDRELEAFGQTYVEPLISGVPSVFTLSGVATDFIRDRENALVVPYCDSDAIFLAIKDLLDDSELTQRLVLKGKSDAKNRFHGRRLATDLEVFYSELINEFLTA